MDNNRLCDHIFVKQNYMFLNVPSVSFWHVSKFIIGIIISLFFLRVIADKYPKPEGDALEYIVMTEAFLHHASPDIRLDDADSIVNKMSRYDSYFNSAYLQMVSLELKKNIKPNDIDKSFFLDKQNGKYYCYHFWLYSLVNLPGRVICEYFDCNPVKTFSITNALLILLVVFKILYQKQFSVVTQICGAILFLFSTIYWYSIWPHPEVFTACMVALSLLLFHDKRYYWAIFFSTLASTQNQPIYLLTIVYIIKTLQVYKITVKNVLLIAIAAVGTIVPLFFYVYHFGKPNLIIEVGYLSKDNISLVRFWGFFFDLDQGIIVGLPLLLLIFIFLFVRKIYFSRFKNNYSLFIVIASLAMLYYIMQMRNWNHGQAIINRYAVWVSTIYVILSLFYVEELGRKTKTILIVCLTAFQVFYTPIRGDFTIPVWDSLYQKNTSVIAMNVFPDFYFTDQQVFRQRVSNSGNSDSVLIFRDYNGNPSKILVHRDTLPWLVKNCFSTPLSIESNAEWTFISQKDIVKNHFCDNMVPVVRCDFERFDTVRRVAYSEAESLVKIMGEISQQSVNGGNFAVRSLASNRPVCSITITDVRKSDKIYVSAFLNEKSWLYCRLINKAKTDTSYYYGGVRNFELPIWQFDRTTIRVSDKYVGDTAYLELMCRENTVVYDNIVVLKTKHRQ